VINPVPGNMSMAFNVTTEAPVIVVAMAVTAGTLVFENPPSLNVGGSPAVSQESSSFVIAGRTEDVNAVLATLRLVTTNVSLRDPCERLPMLTQRARPPCRLSCSCRTRTC
jgi:hypothetical protein